jgi:cellobiose phosphorylase
MCLALFPELMTALERAAGATATARSTRLRQLAAGLRSYDQTLRKAFLADLGDRDYAARAYAAGEAEGRDEMFLEPQPYLLMLDELPWERRRKLCREIERRLLTGETKGARNREVPGMRETGGFWYALHGPFALFARHLNRELAVTLLDRMSLRNHAVHYPNNWVGLWSGGDSFNSDALAPGLRGKVNEYLFPFPVFCAHAHAWPLFCWSALQTEG